MRDARVDAYIAKSAEFARPVLNHLRETVHKACPDVLETMKWSFPHFDYKGIMCSMAAFKEHCSFGFWKTRMMSDPQELFTRSDEGMGSFGRITGLKDLPPDRVLIAYIKEAARLNKTGAKLPPREKPAVRKPLRIPPSLATALRKNRKAKAVFDGFSGSHQREYADWVREAKTDDTRAKRIATAVGWIAEGKVRNWKYVRK